MGRMFDLDHIRTGVDVSTWEDAIRAAGSVLVDVGSIDASYIDDMIAAVHTHGPYIVMMPQFALAHSSPCEAVKKTDMSLITLKHPVDFNSPNGFVSVILCLACTDSSSHIDRLTEIASYLMDEEIIDRIIAAQTVDAIAELFCTNE